jgi:hypothetical protein
LEECFSKSHPTDEETILHYKIMMQTELSQRAGVFLGMVQRRRFEVTSADAARQGQDLESNHRVLYHHEKQLDKVVRRHNSHDRNAMRLLEFNFIKISCVI